MTTSTNSHKAWTDKGGHVTSLQAEDVDGVFEHLDSGSNISQLILK